jgi:polar amino acid transport system substrate-binding protein
MYQVDEENTRIAVKGGAAYDLWLTRSIKKATLIRRETQDDTIALFLDDKLEVLAGLKPMLLPLL